MNLFEDTNPRALKELLAEVHAGNTVLPDFQRDFVWEPGATQELRARPGGELTLRSRAAMRPIVLTF